MCGQWLWQELGWTFNTLFDSTGDIKIFSMENTNIFILTGLIAVRPKIINISISAEALHFLPFFSFFFSFWDRANMWFSEWGSSRHCILKIYILLMVQLSCWYATHRIQHEEVESSSSTESQYCGTAVKRITSTHYIIAWLESILLCRLIFWNLGEETQRTEKKKKNLDLP